MNLKLAIIAQKSDILQGNVGQGRYRVDRRISAVTSSGKWDTLQRTAAVNKKDIMQRYARKRRAIEEMETGTEDLDDTKMAAKTLGRRRRQEIYEDFGGTAPRNGQREPPSNLERMEEAHRENQEIGTFKQGGPTSSFRGSGRYRTWKNGNKYIGGGDCTSKRGSEVGRKRGHFGTYGRNIRETKRGSRGLGNRNGRKAPIIQADLEEIPHIVTLWVNECLVDTGAVVTLVRRKLFQHWTKTKKRGNTVSRSYRTCEDFWVD
ncbi:hypothetical protein JTB14_021327 [Gonioctena quinquepunctata]|nr:hypothetical protein JTB14_021327 [Gonioctena quinquepunctata]